MNKVVIYSGIYILGVIISALAQILLKKSASVERKSKIKEYLNFKTIFAYTIFLEQHYVLYGHINIYHYQWDQF